MKTPTAERNRQVVEKITATSLYQSFENAFEDVAGLGLTLQPMHLSEPINGWQTGTTFSSMLEPEHAHRDCQSVNTRLMRSMSDGPNTWQSRMGLTESGVPVKFGKETIALLRTGEVRHHEPSENNLRALSEVLREEGYEEDRIKGLCDAYAKISVIDLERYQQAIAILEIFSMHITTLIRQLVLAEGGQEPLIVTRAKEYVRQHLENKITLAEVASLSRVSPFYFCKVFKQTTGMTFTVYVNRMRVQWAMEELAKPRLSITEVAYEVGYQSLSQFNRSFRKFVNCSPSEYRVKLSARNHSDTDLHQAA